MKIGVGTTNPAKVAAVKDMLAGYSVIDNPEVIPVKVEVSVGVQPMTLQSTFYGAEERAKESFAGCELSIGIESGLFEIFHEGDLFDICAVFLWDGKQHCFGFSSSFIVPPDAEKFVRQGLELKDAFLKAGLIEGAYNEKSGVVERLTNGRVDRAAFTAQALTMALAQYEHPELYSRGRRVVVSVCSRQKSSVPEPLVAFERYTGSHIAKVAFASVSQELPFFILSGKLGLIRADERIPYYDYLLTGEDVPTLASLVSLQLKKHGIGEIRFYTKCKPAWEPYYAALDQACTKNRVHLVVRELGEDD